MRKAKRILKPFKVYYFFWGHSRAAKADGYGFCYDLAEAYGNASRHLGRGSLYFKAVIEDREQERIIAVLTRKMGEIKIEERNYV